MNDYNPGNVLVNRIHGSWQVSGLFDLMEYYFGDGEADLMRLIAWEYGTRPGNNWFRQGQSFRDYGEPFTVSWRLVVPDAVS